MKLSYIKIVNFRSIEDLKIDLNPTCRVLVGINESGKSNILNALSMLSTEHKPSKEDIREPLPDEALIDDEAYIYFVFELGGDEINRIYEAINSKVLSDNPEAPILKKSKEEINLKDFCKSRHEGAYNVNLIDQIKGGVYWLLDESYETLENWKKPSQSCPNDYFFEAKPGDKIFPVKFSLININDYKDIPQEYLTDISPEDVNDLIGGEIVKIVNNNLPKVIFWKYDEKYLLPSSIKIDEFAANPEICVPLKNMFLLAGITDIHKAINDAKQGTRNVLFNLLNSVAHKTTSHFHDVWKEYKSIEFGLEPDGENIVPSVKEKIRFDFSKRSDGFKRFVSFLLMISVNVKSDLLKNTLLLIDEPDMGLHPSGTRYLRDELIKISKKNYVVYSTHSIFMIDGENIERHIIVKKENEKTSIENVTDSNIVDEEVIYNALGYTIFEPLKKKNILFEGWQDKKLFQIATEKFPDGFKELKKKFKDVGICHAKGVSHIKSVTPILELARKEFIILSDSDAPARQKQKEYQEINGYGIWKRYDEIHPEVKAITSEDFIKLDIFEKLLKEIKEKHPHLPELDPANLSDPRGKLFVINEWLKSVFLQYNDRKKIIDEMKNQIFDDLQISNIEPEYYNFLNNLASLLT